MSFSYRCKMQKKILVCYWMYRLFRNEHLSFIAIAEVFLRNSVEAVINNLQLLFYEEEPCSSHVYIHSIKHAKVHTPQESPFCAMNWKWFNLDTLPPRNPHFSQRIKVWAENPWGATGEKTQEQPSLSRSTEGHAPSSGFLDLIGQRRWSNRSHSNSCAS